jgi:hypothetical protein
VEREHLGPWQDQDIEGLFSQFVERQCPVIPVVLSSLKTTPKLPWPLANLHRVDFRETQWMKQLIWGITGEKPTELSHVPDSQKPVTVPETIKGHLLPKPDDRAQASKGRLGDPEISKARFFSPLAKPPDQEQEVERSGESKRG